MSKADEMRVVTVDLGPDMQWVCQMEWPEGQTQGGPGMLVIRPADPDNYPAGGISQTLLREVDFKAALDTLRRQLAAGNRWSSMREQSAAKMNNLLLAHMQDRTITDTYLALLARAYVSAVSRGVDKPLDYLAELTGKSYASIKNHLWQATRRGLLERSPGRVGGKVTGKAANILAGLV
jgi:hypothetical protein